MSTPLIDRFSQRLASDGDCWLWTGGKAHGYGVFSLGQKRTTRAHRWSYEYHVGPIPEGLDLDHLCRNRACVNPWHLEPVTRRVNVQRGACGYLVVQCKNGHTYSPENTRYRPNGNRYCLLCARIQTRARFEGRPFAVVLAESQASGEAVVRPHPLITQGAANRRRGVELHRLGWSVGRIAEEMGCTTRTVHRWLKTQKESDR